MTQSKGIGYPIVYWMLLVLVGFLSRYAPSEQVMGRWGRTKGISQNDEGQAYVNAGIIKGQEMIQSCDLLQLTVISSPGVNEEIGQIIR